MRGPLTGGPKNPYEVRAYLRYLGVRKHAQERCQESAELRIPSQSSSSSSPPSSSSTPVFQCREGPVSSHNLNSQTFKLRVSNHRTTAYCHVRMPFESSNLPGAVGGRPWA